MKGPYAHASAARFSRARLGYARDPRASTRPLLEAPIPPLTCPSVNIRSWRRLCEVAYGRWSGCRDCLHEPAGRVGISQVIFRLVTTVVLVTLALVGFSPAMAQVPEDSMPPALRGVGLDQHLGDEAPLGLSFVDESGQPVRLADYFDERPVILTLNYYQCPMLCTLELNGLVSALRTLSLEPGRDFRMVTVSINPKEGPELAAQKKAVYVKDYARAGASSGWHFLTGEESSIQELARRVGFRYSFDAASGQYAHAAGIVLLTPSGRISRYFYGVDFPPRDLRLALVESSEGKIGSLADQILLFCFHYDPSSGRYSLAALRVMRLGGLLTVLVLAAVILRTLRRERARRATDLLESSPRAL